MFAFNHEIPLVNHFAILQNQVIWVFLTFQVFVFKLIEVFIFSVLVLTFKITFYKLNKYFKYERKCFNVLS